MIEEHRVIWFLTDQSENKPLFICFGSVHGNEPAGIKAIEFIADLFERHLIDSDSIAGHILGIKGNLAASRANQRFIEEDLNRVWTVDRVSKIQSAPHNTLSNEELECRSILDTIHQITNQIKPSEIIILDLHTTSAPRGIFTIPGKNLESRLLASHLGAPVIHGFFDNISGTIVEYFSESPCSIPIRTIAFEGGQHESKEAIYLGSIAILDALNYLGMFKEKGIYDKLVAQFDFQPDFGPNIPRELELLKVHKITPGDQFKMEPGFYNFKPVKKGTILAQDKNGPIIAEMDAIIWMPLYQKEGAEGFYLLKPVLPSFTNPSE